MSQTQAYLLDACAGTCYIFVMPSFFLNLAGRSSPIKPALTPPVSKKLTTWSPRLQLPCEKIPLYKLVLGHGSGSFGHQAASQFDTRQGVSGAEAWRGFAEVWYQASALNRLVVEALHRAGLPAVTFSPAASVTAHDGKVFIWDTYPLQSALSNGLLPVIHGDVVFDEVRGGTILSTEDLFDSSGATVEAGTHPAGRTGSRGMGRFSAAEESASRRSHPRIWLSSFPTWVAPPEQM